MVYTDTPPTTSELITALARDLRDPINKTFTIEDLLQYINDGIVEVNRIYPIQATDSGELIQGQNSYDTRFSSVYRVEIWSDTSLVSTLPFNDGDSVYGGWELMGQKLIIPPSVVAQSVFDAYPNLTISVTGYARRELGSISALNDPTELDSEAALAVRWFAQYRASLALMNDRSLFKQWQSESNNSDVSMPMLMNMVSTAAQMWERHKRDLIMYRRLPVGSPVVI